MEKILSPKQVAIMDAISDRKKHNRTQLAKDLGYDMSKLSGYYKDLGKLKNHFKSCDLPSSDSLTLSIFAGLAQREES